MTARVLRRGLPVALVALVALGPAAGAEVEPGSGLASYTLAASAPGLALEGLYKDVALTVPETTATLTTGGVGAGLASIAWPGPVAGNAGTTILILQPGVPEQVTMLNDPVRAEARTGGQRTTTYDTVPGTVLTATAEPDAVQASSVTGAVLPVGAVGAVSGNGSVALRDATTAVATSTTTVQDLSLAGGVVEVGAVVSTASATSDGLTASAAGGTTVAGVRVAGVPVEVDQDGIHVAGQSAPNPLPVQAVADAVKALGLTVLLTAPRQVRQGGSVRHVSAALVVVWSQGGQDYALTAGRASVSIDASRAGALPGGAGPVPSGGSAAGDGGTTGSAAPGNAVSGIPVGGDSPSLPLPLPAPLEQVARVALAPVALVLAAGAPAPLAVALLLAAAGLALVLSRLPARLLAAVPAADCEERS
jgi:hypothetical protein